MGNRTSSGKKEKISTSDNADQLDPFYAKESRIQSSNLPPIETVESPLLPFSDEVSNNTNHHLLRRKFQAQRELSSESEYSGPIESWEPAEEDIHTLHSLLTHMLTHCMKPWQLLKNHSLRPHTDTTMKVLGPELSKLDHALEPISISYSLLQILYDRMKTRYTVVKYLELSGIIPKRKIDVNTQQPIYLHQRVYFAYISFFFCIFNIFISILSLLCKCIHMFPYANGRTEFVHIFIAGSVQFIALIISSIMAIKRLNQKGECCELDIYMMHRSVRPSLIMFTLSVIVAVFGLLLDIILLNLFNNLTIVYQAEFVLYSMLYIFMQYYISAYLAVSLFFVLVDAKVCSALIESLGYHIAENTITWEMYLKLRAAIDSRIKATKFQNLTMIIVAYTNVADIIISFAQDPKAIGVETMCYFSRELFFLLFVFFEVSKINEKADGLVERVLESPLTGDLYHKILNHLEKCSISYSIWGWRPKKFNVLYQLVTFVVLPIALRLLLTYYPPLRILISAQS